MATFRRLRHHHSHCRRVFGFRSLRPPIISSAVISRPRPLIGLLRMVMSLLVLLWSPAAFAEDAETVAILRGFGLTEAQARAVAAAAEKAEAKEDYGPVRALLANGDVPVVMGAAALLLEAEEPFEGDVLSLLRRRKGNSTALILALSLGDKAASIDYLVKRLASEKETSLLELIRMVLQVRSGEEFPDAATWKSWWSANRSKFKEARPGDDEVFEEKLRRMQGAMARLRTAKLREALGQMIRNGNDAVDKVASVFGKLFSLQDQAATMKTGPAVRRAFHKGRTPGGTRGV
jgi:hypothetical protein